MCLKIATGGYKLASVKRKKKSSGSECALCDMMEEQEKGKFFTLKETLQAFKKTKKQGALVGFADENEGDKNN